MIINSLFLLSERTILSIITMRRGGKKKRGREGGRKDSLLEAEMSTPPSQSVRLASRRQQARLKLAGVYVYVCFHHCCLRE